MAFNGAPPAEQQLVELEQPLALVRSSLIKARLRLRLYNTFASLPLKTFSLVCSMFFLNSLLFIFTQIVEVNTFQIAHVATGANLQTVFSLVLSKKMFAFLLVLSCVCFQQKNQKGTFIALVAIKASLVIILRAAQLNIGFRDPLLPLYIAAIAAQIAPIYWRYHVPLWR